LSNAGNADIFKQSFREEAREILVDLESALLELNDNRGDQELVGRVFRGLHTIKGSGAMFGFESMAAFTHNLETAFDEVRNGRLQIGSELIDLTLSALDQIRAMIEESGETVADPAVCAEILAKVRSLAGIKEKPPKKVKSAAVGSGAETASQATASTSVADAGAAAGQVREWAIHFAPGPDFMLNGTNPLLLVRELKQMGGLAVRASMALIPPLAELDPERCYISWEMMLATAAGLDAIRDVFIFVEDSCELTIEPASSLAGERAAEEAAPRTAGAARPAADQAPPTEADLTAQALEDKRTASGGRRNYDKPDNASSLRVPAAKLDQFVDLVGELVTVQARLSELAARSEDAEIVLVSEEIERLTSSLRENSMTIRMMPIRSTFEKFRRLVHDLARDLGKNVELTIEGAETELDKTVIDQLGDPLMHLIRNSMDHGIEPPEKRAAGGKPATASIHLSARHSGASVLIGVADDGGGINAEAVRNRAVERGLVAADAQLTEAETFALLFEPGFSTAKQVTDISGRGVGMDVVRQRVDSLRGNIEVVSKPGEGTSVTLRLPLTLAIIDGLLVSVGEAFFVVPLANILECIELTAEEIERANGKQVANVRGEIVPYICLRKYFNIPTARPEIEQIMVVETEGGRYGFVVDRVLGDCQTVIKNLGRVYRHVQVVSGATILGNGMVALILDPERLAADAVRCASRGMRTLPATAAKPGVRRSDVAPQRAF
jgi:two-component system chemotaxis sensor kinase CheA